MGWIFLLLSLVLLFLEGIGARFIPNQVVWAAFCFILGCLVGNWMPPINWKRS